MDGSIRCFQDLLMSMKVSMTHIPLPFSNGLVTISESNILRVDFSCEVRLCIKAYWKRLGRKFWICSWNSIRFAQFGLGGIKVEGL